MSRTPQLALPFPVNERCTLETFEPDSAGRNRELIERLSRLPEAGGFVGIWLWGSAGAGVSHLLQGVCQRHAEAGRGAAYLPLAELPRHAGLLEGLERFALLAVDDVHTWVGEEPLEAALVGAYQQARTAGRQLVFGSGGPAARLPTRLPDLASRLGSLESYRVHDLDDAAKGTLLRRLAAGRGLTLTEPVLRFWLARGNRDLARLLAQLDELDRAALRDRRALTIPLLKQVLGL